MASGTARALPDALVHHTVTRALVAWNVGTLLYVGLAALMFALHYAHDCCAAAARHQPPPLQFPVGEVPGYSDFFYVSAVIGTSGQTADIAFASCSLRRIGSVHCILA